MEAYCMKCKEKREMNDPQATFNAKGSPVTIGKCGVCGTKLYRMGRTDAHASLTPPEKPAKVEKGQTFSCTGTAEDGATYTFTVEITGDKSFLVTDVTPNGATSGTGVSGDTTPSEGSSVTSGT